MLKKGDSNNKAFQTAGTDPIPSANTNPYALLCLVTWNSAKVWEAYSPYYTKVSVFMITDCTCNLTQNSTHPRERCQKMNLKLSVDPGSVSSSWDAAMYIFRERIRRWFRGCNAYQSLTLRLTWSVWLPGLFVLLQDCLQPAGCITSSFVRKSFVLIIRNIRCLRILMLFLL